ncbi:hypothetical protein K469DRAFT_278267 [Zopfia rhizophila CBS 207.26]|uniref:NACHT domain-containing protein n=1 Tax=Zopfia rhizophila CBS 207.26 TaxID=1314779 RepID=A0A6A6DPT2_9PEZI|nr:hypothetical protein K469DRAFT_278267 [Zopfia rhizophila CBS 207.26]
MKGIGQWILDVATFVKWRDGSSSNRTLWCNGAPGAGKTYISSVIIDHLEDLAGRKNNPVLYFYFDYREQSEQTPFKILQTLLRQLLSTYSHVPSEASSEAAELQQRILKKQGLPGWQDLKTLFIDLCGLSEVFIILDALDECDAIDNRRPIIELIQDIKNSGARLLVTS